MNNYRGKSRKSGTSLFSFIKIEGILGKSYDKNYYKILQVDIEACDEVIEVAYKRLARILHPDVNPDKDTTEEFKVLGKAYEVLKNDRKNYDEYYKKVYAKVGGSPSNTNKKEPIIVSPFTNNSAFDILFREVPDYYKNYSGNKFNNILKSIRNMKNDISRMESEIKRLWWRAGK